MEILSLGHYQVFLRENKLKTWNFRANFMFIVCTYRYIVIDFKKELHEYN